MTTTPRAYEIRNTDGVYFGTYLGDDCVHALATMHRTNGYDVTVNDDGELIFVSEDDARICGGVDAWWFKLT